MPMDQSGTTVDATAQDVANLALADASAARTALGLGTADAPSFAGLTITGSGAVVIPHIHGSIAGDFYVHVRNTSGGSLAAGTPVYATGSVGDTDRLTVAACDPTDPAKMPAIALLKTTLANNDDGDGVVLGELRPFNTGGFQIRDRLYVGTGGLQATPPASGIVQAVGSVARVNAETGTILVGISAAMAKVGISGAYADLSGLPTLGTAAATDAADYATAAQGALADSATQPGDLAAVATSGDYSDLSGTPTLGSAAATDATDYATAAQGGLADSAVQPGDLATVATSGDYDDLTNLPTLGTAAATAATDYAPAAQGVTGGDGHNHSGGDGAQIAYSDLSGVPTVATTSAAGLQAATGFGTITYAASVALNLAELDGEVNTITLTGNLQLTTSNLANGRRTGLRLIAGAATRTLTFPVDWQFVSTKPATLPANKVARMTIECHGSSNASVIAGISIQP